MAVFDLGGGTFDISILEIGNGVFEVLSTAGDTFLGGEDFDRRIIEWLVFGFAKEHRIDLRKDKMALQRLKDVAERAKCELSLAKEAHIDLPFIIAKDGETALNLERILTREKFEELTVDLMEKCLQICKKTLADANIDKSSIEDVILVGGMTRVPKIQQMVAQFFGKEPYKGVHPDEVVALGAAIQAAALLDAHSEVLLLDVTPHSLGIMIVGGYFHRLIQQNTTVPTQASHIFTTVKDNQTSVKILVLQGESDRAEENELLGEFILQGLRRAPAKEVEIEVTFEISADGIVSVAAKDLETGLKQAITVTATSGLTEEEIRKMVEASKEYMLDQKQSEEEERHRQEAERLIGEIEALFPRVIETLAGRRLRAGRHQEGAQRRRPRQAGGAGPRYAGAVGIERRAGAHAQHVQGRRAEVARRVGARGLVDAARMEAAVALYGDGNLEGARAAFAELVERFADDARARRYLRWVERALAEEQAALRLNADAVRAVCDALDPWTYPADDLSEPDVFIEREETAPAPAPTSSIESAPLPASPAPPMPLPQMPTRVDQSTSSAWRPDATLLPVESSAKKSRSRARSRPCRRRPAVRPRRPWAPCWACRPWRSSRRWGRSVPSVKSRRRWPPTGTPRPPRRICRRSMCPS